MPSLCVVRDVDLPAAVLAACRAMVLDAFDGSFTEQDWEHAAGGWRLLLVDSGAVVSHAAVVPRTLWVGSRAFAAGYVEAVATAGPWERQGHGSAVMAQAGGVIRSRYELGGLSTSRRAFYARLGWESWTGPSWVRDGDVLTRTPDEDDGLMVLRCRPSATIDLADPITCRSRAGDDW